jgi:hypothetical protein
VFVRHVSADQIVKENVELGGIKSNNFGLTHFSTLLTNANVPLDKIVSMTTDGAPPM